MSYFSWVSLRRISRPCAESRSQHSKAQGNLRKDVKKSKLSYGVCRLLQQVRPTLWAGIHSFLNVRALRCTATLTLAH